MKCGFILLSVLAFCYSSPVGAGRKVSIGEDGSIQILGQYGRWIVISKNSQNREKDIEIAVGGPSGVLKRIHINEENKSRSIGFQEPQQAGGNIGHSGNLQEEREQRNPADILSEIFRKYQGVVDEQSYEALLQKIHSYVQSGDLSAAVYDILKDSDVASDINQQEKQIKSVSGAATGDIQYGSNPNVLKQNVAWPQEYPSYVNRYSVPQVDKSVLYGKVPADYQYGVQYPAYRNVINGQRYAPEEINELLPVSRELLGLYRPQQNNVFQQWANYINHQQGIQSEQQSYNDYLQLINIQQSQLSPLLQRQLNGLHQQWISFQNQLTSVEQKHLSHLYKQWISCQQVLSAEEYQCNNLNGEWVSFLQRLTLGERQLLSTIHQQWVTIQQELNMEQLTQLEQLWSTLYQRWVGLDLTLEQQHQLSVIVPQWVNYNEQMMSGKWSQFQQEQYDNLRNQMVTLHLQLDVEQQQKLNNFYQICVIIERLQINPGEWIQLKQRLNVSIRQLVSGQSEYFLRLFQKWVMNVENVVNFEQVFYNLYQQFVLFQEELTVAEQQQFRDIYPKWVSLDLQRFSGPWSQYHEVQYQNLRSQWMRFKHQLSIAQQEMLHSLSKAGHWIAQQNINGENWYTLKSHLEIFVRQMVISSQQDMRRADDLKFYDVYKLWVESVSRKVSTEQLNVIYGQSQYKNDLIHSGLVQQGQWSLQQPTLYPVVGRQSTVYNPWQKYMLQQVQRDQVVPQQYIHGAMY